MSRWVYFLSLAAAVVTYVLAHLLPEQWVVVLFVAMCLPAGLWWRYVNAQTEDQRFSRTFDAAPDAVYSALYGSLGELGYTVTTRDPDSRAVQVRGGRGGPWIGRLGVLGNAIVRHADGRRSEIVIEGHLDRADKDGVGFAVYPEGMGLRAKKIFERVEATVVTYAMIDPDRTIDSAA